MIKELLYKWFGLEPFPCSTCEVLRAQLDESNRERKHLLSLIVDKDKPVESKPEETSQPIPPTFVPWRVRQQMLEAEDRKRAQLLKEKHKEIADAQRSESIEKLEKELDLKEGA